jgi:hypothetical protein
MISRMILGQLSELKSSLTLDGYVLLFLFLDIIDFKDFQFLQLMNHRRGDGTIVAFEVVPFTDGSDPSQAPVSLGFGFLYN